LDICPACFEKIKQIVVGNYEKTMTHDTKRRGRRSPLVTCELTGTKLVGTYNYYHCNVVLVDVKMSGQPNVCTNCQTHTLETSEPCSKCGGVDFVRPALTKTDDRHVEINVSEEAYQGMVNKAETIRKVAGEWATKT
jgi:rRNA maturation protein Nop10